MTMKIQGWAEAYNACQLQAASSWLLIKNEIRILMHYKAKSLFPVLFEVTNEGGWLLSFN